MQRDAHLTNAALMARRSAAVARGVGQAHEVFVQRALNAELWDVEGRRDAKRFVGHTASVWSVALSADEKFAISGSMDGTARVWNVANGQELRKYAEHSSLVSAVAFNPNGRWGISGGFDGVVAAWKVATGDFISQSDINNYAPVAVLGKTVVNTLFPDGGNPIGQYILIQKIPFQVIGTLEPKCGR